MITESRIDPDAIAEISSELNLLANGLCGVQPILRAITDGALAEDSAAIGNALESVGILSDYINHSISLIAIRLEKMAAQGA